MQSVIINPFLYGFILAAILNTVSSKGEARVQLRTEPDSGIHSRNAHKTPYVKSQYRAVTGCASITTGETCVDPTDATKKVHKDIEERITKNGANPNYHTTKLTHVEKRVLFWEHAKVEDFLFEAKQKCFHECINGRCSCEDQLDDFSSCTSYKQKNVDCSPQVEVVLRLEVANSLVYRFLKMDCAKKATAGNGNPCIDEIDAQFAKQFGLLDAEDSLVIFARMSERDWQQKIKNECACQNGRCESGTCQCPDGDGSTYQQPDLDSTCKNEVRKIVSAFGHLAQLTGSKGPGKEGFDAGPPGSGAGVKGSATESQGSGAGTQGCDTGPQGSGESQGSGAGSNAKTEQPKQSCSIAQIDVAIPAMVLLGILMTPYLAIGQ